MRLNAFVSRRLGIYRPRLHISAGGSLTLAHRLFGVLHQDTDVLLKDFFFAPNFFDASEQKVLLRASLRSLDAAGTRQMRRKRKTIGQRENIMEKSVPVQEIFLADEYYEFEEGHYDGVIKNFREMHLREWDIDDTPSIKPLLERLRSLIPDVETQTHLLHLSSRGEILPHVDNTESSGSWILGVSLGAERLMRMENIAQSDDCFDISLPSGSVYIQRDHLRFNYKHSILGNAIHNDRSIGGGQRLSIILRDRLPAANGAKL